ncbi:7021_t:CDS:1, partial [Entrophospora sp. SA101]
VDKQPSKQYWKRLKNQIIYEAEKPHRQELILKYLLKKWPRLGPNKQVAETFLEEIDNPLRYSQVDIYTILQHCLSFKDPPIYQGDAYTIYSERYLEEQVVPVLVKEAKKLDSYFPEGNIITVKSAINMGIKAPIFRCMLLDCEGEKRIHLYSPKNMEHHLNTKHNSFFEQIVAEHDKVWVYLKKDMNLFDDDKCKDQKSQETCQNEHRSIECKRKHEEINNGNKHQEKRPQTNSNQLQKSQETSHNEHSRFIEHKRKHEGINNGNRHQGKRPQTNNQLQKSQETCQNEHRSIKRKRKHEGINNGNEHQEKRPRTNNRFQKSQEVYQSEWRSVKSYYKKITRV